MVDSPKQEIKLFYCYAQEDKLLRDELEKHLKWLKRRYQLKNWHDREILPGDEWEQAIDKHLDNAHLILLLISPDFMASDYCYGKEMQRALARHKEGTCRVVPILLRPTFCEDAPFNSLQLLPTNARPITRWPDRDEAFQNVTTEINRTIKDLLISLETKEEWFEEDNTLNDLKSNEEAVVAYDQPIHLNPNNADYYYNKAYVLDDLKSNEEAVVTYDQPIRLNPNNADYYFNIKGDNLKDLKRYEQAVAAYDQAIRLNPNNANYYNNKGSVLRRLKLYEQAVAAYDQAIRLNPNNANYYNNKGVVFDEIKRYEEAVAAYDQAIHLNPSEIDYYINKGYALNDLKRYEEAKQAFEKARQLMQ